jgi:Tol biopolymer transport system component
MALSPGARLGPYEIVGPLGAGGMGEVYRARDTRLDRSVAIKVLPSHLSAHPDLRARFEREARAVSSLNHAHICVLHDVGHQDGIDFIVMELVEGETLLARLKKGPLPLDQTLRYGIEIADALDKAHRQGIVHRDLKPGNVMLTKAGAKLMDFGLAKRGLAGESDGGVSTLPTQEKPLTEAGSLLGTFQYMSPEQLEGKDADPRADIWALGCVLFEMATGKRAFEGKSQASLISAIMTSEPQAIAQLQPMTPPALDRLVKVCLAKDPDERWQSAHDIAGELKWIAEGTQAGVAGPVVARRRNRERLSWGLTGVALVLAVAALLRSGPPKATFAAPVRTSIVVPDKSALRGAALSPDGTRLVFGARDSSGKNLLWIRPLDSLAAQPLPGTENPAFPFWSPDSRSIGFFADGKLRRIDASGGPAQTLCDAPVARGGTWNRDGVILFAPVTESGLYRVAASGGIATPVTRIEASRGETTHRWPLFLPDGRHFVYLVANFGSGGQSEKLGIYVASLDSGDEKLLLNAKSSVAYAPPGYLLFFREGNLLAQPFDAERLQTTGEPILVAEQIHHFPQHYKAVFSVSENGLLLYQSRSATGVSQLGWFDRRGNQVGSMGAPANQANPRISPDGKRVAVDVADPETGNLDIWVHASSGGIPARLTSDPALDALPIWSPDGGRIVFMSLRGGHADLYQKSSSGAGNEEAILQSERAKYATDWSSDGRFILHRALDPTTNVELWVLPVGGDAKATPFIKAPFGVSQGQFSPDGRWVAYASNESGRWEIYVAPFPGPGGNWKVSSAGGSEPRWRRDGNEIFYLAPDAKLMALDVKEGPTFEADVPRPLFQTRRREHISSSDLFSYDVSPDGQRFLVNTDVGEATSPPLTVVLNWTAGLKKR